MEQLRKVQQDAYYNVYKSTAITDWSLPVLVRLRVRARGARATARRAS